MIAVILSAVNISYAQQLNLPLLKNNNIGQSNIGESMASSIESKNKSPFLYDDTPVIVKPITIFTSKDITLKSNIINKDIEITVTNLTKKEIKLNYIAYSINSTVCAENKNLKQVINKKSIKSGYYISRADLLYCYSLADKLANSINNYKLIDLSDDINIKDYENFTEGFFLLPIIIELGYDTAGINTHLIKRTFFIYVRK
ncbi:MAG: hypothetical protein K2P99_04590 [Burkholderiales bacterium]|nr:hypothetical protein [Burkholderiales bacterium]